MKFKLKTMAMRKAERKEKYRAYRAKISVQHSWFAWHPVQINPGEFVWLTKVYRQFYPNEYSIGPAHFKYWLVPNGMDQTTDENFA